MNLQNVRINCLVKFKKQVVNLTVIEIITLLQFFISLEVLSKF